MRAGQHRQDRFSIHKRIEGGATFRADACRFFRIFVSVSTSGSKGVQLGGSTFSSPPYQLFQYPQADRRGCNKEMKAEVTYIRTGFSIHKRIEGGATCSCVFDDRREKVFQYRQADRRGCNNAHVFLMTNLRKCFSIHKRIEGGATKESGGSQNLAWRFQYPQADRRGCNLHVLH